MLKRDSPGVIFPPPLLFCFTLGLGLLIEYFVLRIPMTARETLRYTIAAPLFVIGGLLIAVALGLFWRANTRPEPWQPSTAIVTGGVYRFTRNPMYLGMALAYAAAAVALDSGISLLLLVPLIGVVHIAVIGREERYLMGKFGNEYLRYKERVRPWL